MNSTNTNLSKFTKSVERQAKAITLNPVEVSVFKMDKGFLGAVEDIRSGDILFIGCDYCHYCRGFPEIDCSGLDVGRNPTLVVWKTINE